MKIYTHNFNPDSNSGPNKFTRTLFRSLIKSKKVTISNQDESDVEFCLIQQQTKKVKPMLLRLDGIWFNSSQDFNRQNKPIIYSYFNADAVVFQSEFNKTLTEKWFGKHKNPYVIHNAADNSLIRSANTRYWDKKFGKETEVWSCASNWRPHKRLRENVRYFLKFAPKDAVFAIAGALPMDYAKEISNYDKRIYLMGDLDYMSLLSLYKRSSTFIHLSYLDHCPNVVVDAQAAGCRIICSSSGGTREIVEKGRMIIEDDWDFKPCELYNPPPLNFDFYEDINSPKKINMNECSMKYFKIMESIK